MSRCFPYPPPGYVRNPVAAAEAEATTKLQKEREKTEKKKEKKNDKKVLQQGGETSKSSKRSHKKRKHDDMIVGGQKSSKVLKESIELLEKSGLSEEHGAPCFIQTLHDSPESSQDSSKRRKVALPSPGQNKNGSILRIKIKREQDSPVAVLERSRASEHPAAQQIGSCKMMLKSAATLQQSIKGDSQAEPGQGWVQPPATVMQRVDQSIRKVDPSSSLKATVGRVDPTPGKMMESVNLSLPKVIGRADPAHAKVMQRVDPSPLQVLHRVDPLLSGTQRVDPLPDKVLQRVDPPLVAQRVEPTPAHQPSVLLKPKVPLDTGVAEQQQQQLKEEPSFSGRKTEAAPVPEAKHAKSEKQSKSERKKIRKAEKKEKKFRDLFITWNPPLFEMKDMDLGDQDWLLGSRKPDAVMRDDRASDGFLPAQSMGQQFSLQPRAIHLPDLHIYQLPYVVPF